MLKRTPRYFKKAAKKQLEGLKKLWEFITKPVVLIAIGVLLVAWLASHYFGVGFLLDAALLYITYALIGWTAFTFLSSMIKWLYSVYKADSLDDLEACAEKLADILATVSLEVLLIMSGFALAKIAKKVQGAVKGAKESIDDALNARRARKEAAAKKKRPAKSREEVQREIFDRTGTDFKNHPLRKAYEDEVAELARYKDKIKPNMTDDELEAIAREASQARRDLGVKYKDATPQPLRDFIYHRNMTKYEDPLGPTFERVTNSVRKKLAADRKIPTKDVPLKDIYKYLTEGASRPNKGINSVLEEFGTWLKTKPDDYILQFAGG